MIEMFHKTGGERGKYALQNWILSQLEELEGAIAAPALYCFTATGNSQVVILLFYPII